MQKEKGGERSAVSRNLMRMGLTWCAIVATIGAATSIVEAATGQSRAAVEGALALAAIALFPGFICLALSWIFSPPREP